MANKYIIIFFLITIAFAAKCQQLPEGTFVYSTGFTNEEITFKNNYNFEYKYSSCTGEKEGFGTYTFNKKQLLLTFENPKDKPLPKATSLIRQPTQNDTSYLSFTFLNQKDTTSVAGVIVKFMNKLSGKIFGTQSNSKGQATLKIKNTNFPIDFDINYIGMKSKSITIDISGNYSIEFPLNVEFSQPYIKGDSLQFIINDYDDYELLLKPIKEKQFRTFIKKEEN